jgi:hypothetical protein
MVGLAKKGVIKMTEQEFEAQMGVNMKEVLAAKQTKGGVDFYTLPISSNTAVNWNGYRFGILKPYKRGKWREKAISWILEQFEKGTLKPLTLRHGLENVEIE